MLALYVSIVFANTRSGSLGPRGQQPAAHATVAFVPLPEVPPEEIAPTARPNPLPTRPFTFEDALTSENDDESSGGETRTLNLADDPDQDPEQRQLE